MAEALETWRVHGVELAIGEPEERLRERALAAPGIDATALRGFRIGVRQRAGSSVGGPT